MSTAAAIAEKLGLTEQQVAEVVASLGTEPKPQGTWSTTTSGIVTHQSGRRHFSCLTNGTPITCEECA
jgi:hypothetical protein